MQPDDFSILYQDTDAGPWDMGSSGSQTTFNNGRAVVEAAREVRDKLLDLASEQLEVAREDLELAAGEIRVAGAPGRSVSIAHLAGEGTAILGKGSGAVPEAPPAEPGEGCIGRLGLESFLEPQTFTHAVRVKVDRETGVVRILQVAAAHDSGTIVNRVGADGQVYGGVVMGIGQALSRAHAVRRRRPPAQPAPSGLQARDSLRRTADRCGLDREPRRERRPARLERGRRAAVRANSRRNRQRRREGDRSTCLRAADDPGARLGGPPVTQSYAAAETVEEALAAMANGGRAVAGGTDLVVGARQGKAPLPDSIVAIHRLAELRRIDGDAEVLRDGRPDDPRGDRRARARSRAADRARGRGRDRRLARHSCAGHRRREPDECLARDGTGRTADVLRRLGDPALAARRALGARGRPLRRPRQDDRASRASS